MMGSVRATHLANMRSAFLLATRRNVRMTVPTVQRCYAALHTSASVWDAKTGLYDFHVKHGAKIVPFGGYSMPLTYEGVGQVASHKHVRCSLRPLS